MRNSLWERKGFFYYFTFNFYRVSPYSNKNHILVNTHTEKVNFVYYHLVKIFNGEKILTQKSQDRALKSWGL